MAESDKINKNDLISQEALDSIEQLKALLNAAQKELLDLITAGKSLDTSIKSTTKISKLTSSIKTLSASIEKLYATQAKLDSAQSKLTGTTNSNTSATSRNTSETNKNTSSKNSNTKSSSTLGNATKSLFSSITNLAGAYLTLNGLMNLFGKIVGDTTKLDSLNFTLKTIISNTFELAQTHEYLNRIVQNFGVNLVDTTQSYVRFRAAVGQSNLTVKEGQDIFESVAKASATLGLSQEKTNDVFLALEQMLSKGSVMSEELRRQMGQHLPVAMNAMALAAKDAGISVSGTTAELLDLMKKGKVAAETVLPFFAKEVEKALGIEQLTKVDNLAAAQQRLTTAWMEFVKALAATPGLTSAYNTIAEFTSGVANLIASDSSKIEKGADKLISGVNDKLDTNIKREQERADILKKINTLIEEQSKLKDDDKNKLKLTQQIFSLNQEMNKISSDNTSEERKIVLTEELNRLLAEQKALGENKSQVGGIPIEPIDVAGGTLGKIGKQIARGFWKSIGASTERFDVSFPNKVISQPEKNAELLAKSYTQAIEKIRANWDLLIAEKEKKSLFDKDKQTFEQGLTIFKAQQNAKFAVYKQSQEEMMLQAHDNVVKSGADELDVKRADAGLEMDMDTNLFNFRNKQMDDLLKYTKGNAKARAETEKEVADQGAAFAKKKTDFNISEDKRETDEYQKEIERRKDADIAAVEGVMSGKLLALQQAAVSKSKGVKTERGFELIDSQLQTDSLKVTEQGLQDLLDVENLTTNEIANINQKLADTKKAIADTERAQTEKDFKRKKELTQQAFEYGKQTMDATFSVFTAFQDASLQRLEWQHDRDVNLAGDNVAKKIAAENKYDIEKRKLMRRQAILQKAQAAANVIINTAQAIMATLGETGLFGLPLTPIIAGIGALQLAAVLAQPIPAYELGGRHSGGLAKMSERGSELFIPDGGIPMLTPAKETIANMPSGTFIPNDETQRILAQGALSNFINESSDINMGETNSILRTISNKKETFYSKGFKITNKSNILGTYVTRN